mgnify:CR=1 FL=1
MIPPQKLTERAQEAMQIAYGILQRMNHSQLDVEHLALALLEQTDGTATEVLRRMNVDVALVRRRLEDVLGTFPKVSFNPAISQVYATPRVNAPRGSAAVAFGVAFHVRATCLFSYQ